MAPIVTAAFEHLIRRLELAGVDLTRKGVIETIEIGLDGNWRCGLCLGPTMTGAQNCWVYETQQLVLRWSQPSAAKKARRDTGHYVCIVHPGEALTALSALPDPPFPNNGGGLVAQQPGL